MLCKVGDTVTADVLHFCRRVNSTYRTAVYVSVILHTEKKNMAVIGVGQFKIEVLCGTSQSCSGKTDL